jgi:tetratricopeptide (TPR) repeat protein
MPLNTQKWTPETYLRLVNFGKGTFQVSCSTSLGEEKTSKIVVLGPDETIYLKVKDFLPPGIDEPWKLGDNNLKFHLKNISEFVSSFNILEEGPFRKSELQPEYPSEAHRIIAQYQDALAESDYYTMKLLVKEPILSVYKSDTNFYSLLCHARGKVFNFLDRIDEADTCYEEGWKNYRDDRRWHFCFDWANTLCAKLIKNINSDEKAKAIQKAFNIFDLAKKWSKGIEFEKYNLMAADGRKAFCLLYLGEHEEARHLFGNFDFSPIPLDDFDDPMLNMFFGEIAYSFAAAIDLRDSVLLRNLCKIIATGRPEIILEPSPQLCMRKSFGNTHERGRDEITNKFGHLIGNRAAYALDFPNLGEFLEYINVGNEVEMNRYFGYTE